MGTMGQLFVSYASGDRARTLEVVEVVRAQGIDVWIDQAGIAGGAAYGAEIANALRDAEAVLLIASDASLASKNVRQEIMLAWRYDRPIIPLILHPLLFPDDVAYWLEGAQWIEVFDRPADAWLTKLWQALARHGIVDARDERDAQAAVPAVPVELVGNLPSGLSPIIGRERELEELLTLLANGRTITLTGPGGTGKTRLALEAGRRIGPSYEGGVWFLDLSSTHAAELVLPGIAVLLDVDVPPDGSPVDAISAMLAGKPTLLILDNLEQILDAASDLAALQDAAPDLTLLMTSRAPLQLPREWVYAVPQLALPDLQALPAPSAMLENPAVRLFVTRAQQAKPDFQLIDGNARAVAEICHRLDGLPLAIEIAAARVRLLPPAAILTRLGSRLNLLTRGSAVNARQQTMRDTIGWSYNLLEPNQQWAFRTFAVFEGGASVEAAETVLTSLNAETSETPLDLLEHLVDQSLLVIGTTDDGEPRLRMLETVREFASEQLAASDADGSTQGAHVRYFLEWIEGIGAALSESRDSQTVRAVRGELDNLRGALGWLHTHDEDGRRLRLANALFPYWRIAGPYTEATDELDGALMTERGGDPRQRAWALSALGWLAGARGEFSESIALNEQALSLFEDMGDRERQESVLWQLATAMEWAGNYSGARAHHQTRLTLLSPDDTLEIARVNHDLGRLTFIEGDYDQAIQLLTDAIEIYRAAADSQLIAHGLLDLAIAEYLNADGVGALQHLEECIRLLQVLQDDYGLAIAVVNRGRAEQIAGEFGQAQRTLEQSLESADRLGDASLRAIALYGLGTNAAALGQWGDAVSHLQAAAVLPQQIGDRRRLAEIIERMAQVALGRGETETAALLLGRAQTERLEGGTTVPPAHRERHEATVEAAEHALGAERFSVLIDEGKRRDIDELLHLVPVVAGQESA
jgi:predicted ATPase